MTAPNDCSSAGWSAAIEKPSHSQPSAGRIHGRPEPGVICAVRSSRSLADNPSETVEIDESAVVTVVTSPGRSGR